MHNQFWHGSLILQLCFKALPISLFPGTPSFGHSCLMAYKENFRLLVLLRVASSSTAPASQDQPPPAVTQAYRCKCPCFKEQPCWQSACLLTLLSSGPVLGCTAWVLDSNPQLGVHKERIATTNGYRGFHSVGRGNLQKMKEKGITSLTSLRMHSSSVKKRTRCLCPAVALWCP